MYRTVSLSSVAAIVTIASAAFTTPAAANPFALFAPFAAPFQQQQQVAPAPGYSQDSVIDEDGYVAPAHLKRQVVNYPTSEAPGTIVIDTPNTYLYFVLGNGRAIRYGIGVGREGFTWAGTQSVSRKAEWPDWHPPQEMIERQPYLPRFMAGGPGNPLGARAMYLGSSIYRIHGTNDPTTIGKRVSSGCIRLTNEDVSDLYARVNVGTKVVVLPMGERRAANPNSIEMSSARTVPAGRSVFNASRIY